MKARKLQRCLRWRGGCAPLFVMVLAMLVGHVENVGAVTIYSTNGNGTALGTIDSGTGVGTPIGSSGTVETWAAAFDNNDGTLYTLINGWTTPQLATFNLSTGAATTVGSPGLIGEDMIALEVADDGTMYGGGYNNGFYTIDKTTGAGTFIGSMGAGLNNLMDLAFDSSGTLWATVINQLWTINTSTGAATSQMSISGISSGDVMGIMFDENDTLFATAYVTNSPLYTINLSTGAATAIGNTGFNQPHGGDILLSSSAEVPEPSTLLLLGTGLVGLAAYRRKRRG